MTHPRTLRTTFVGATDTNGEKVRVSGPHGQLTVSYDYGAYDMHDTAVSEYLARHNMPGALTFGANDRRRSLTRSGRGYTYLLDDGAHADTSGGYPTGAYVNGLLYV
jgi:hypothetical protein